MNITNQQYDALKDLKPFDVLITGTVDNYVITDESFNAWKSQNQESIFDELRFIATNKGGVNLNPEDFPSDEGYVPKITTLTESISLKAINSSFEISITGTFLDYLDDFSISATDMTGVSVAVNFKSFKELLLQVNVNSVIQEYTVTLKKDSQVFNFTFNTADLKIIIPSLNGTGESLWVKGTGASNEVTLEDGIFEAQQANGEGWNENASYGNFVSPISKISHEFIVERDSNAYCFIRFNSDTTVGTGGNPRIYQNNGGTLDIYGIGGTVIGSTPLSQGDTIEVDFTATSMEVIKDGVSVVTDTGDYTSAMVGSYVTFTGYRFSRFIDINTKIFE